ncbi:Aldo/keto reductase, partial [Aureobasidium melanogenum]
MAQKTYNLASRLNNGLSMPQIHLGVYLTSGNETTKATRYALEVCSHNEPPAPAGALMLIWCKQAGYLAVDSAQMYHNEREVGNAITDFLKSPNNIAGLKREDIHYTSKLASNSDYNTARKSIKKSVQECGLGYIDLFLLHSPYGGKKARLESWRAVEDAIADGEVKIGGVSNYGVQHLQELLDSKPRIPPAVNQIEVHPFNTRTDITSFCQKNDIMVEAYAPLARALRMKHPVIVELSKKYNCNPGQLLVRWSVQHGYVPLPKSVKKERIVQNGDIGGFEIDESDMAKMDGLDEYLVTDWDPTDAP